MITGLRTGSKGRDVERLQRVLASQGYVIDAAEPQKAEFGPSTLAALQAFQAQRGLRVTRSITQATLAPLLQAEAALGTAAEPPARAQASSAGRGLVKGQFVDADGVPVARAAIQLFEKRLRDERALGDGVTDEEGRFTIRYPRGAALSLFVRAVDAQGKALAESATVFRATAKADIDLTGAKDGVMRQPSQFTTLKAALAAELGDTLLESLKQDKDSDDLSFLSKTASRAYKDIVALYVARAQAPAAKLDEATLFALFSQGAVSSLSKALADLPDAGIDPTFMTQIMGALLANARPVLQTILQAAVKANVVPASYEAKLDAELDQLDVLRRDHVATSPYIRGKTALKDLLEAGGVAARDQAAFIQAYSDTGKSLFETWRRLRADEGLSKAARSRLYVVLRLGEQLAGNLIAIKDTLQRLDSGEIASVRHLSLMDLDDWSARMRTLDAPAETISQVVPGQTAEERIERYARAVVSRLARREPTLAFVGALDKAKASSFTTKDEIVAFIKANPNFDFKNTHIDRFVAAGKLSMTPVGLAELKIAQRLHRIALGYKGVEALHTAGLKSAQAVYTMGRTPFIAKMSEALGGETAAKTVFARAQTTHAAALATWGRYNLAINGSTVPSLLAAKPDIDALTGLPDLQALFGSLDYFACDDCQSVYSPAAYLVDLLQYLALFLATPQSGSSGPFAECKTPRDALFVRRPDINVTALTCNNSNVVIPTIDIVNEVLEAALAGAYFLAPKLFETEGTAEERRALPQVTQPDVAASAYGMCLSNPVTWQAAPYPATWPLNLPFDLQFARTAAYVAALGTSRAALLKLFRPQTDAAVAGAVLGINASRQELITQAEVSAPWFRWALDSDPANLIDPKTRQPYEPPPATWLDALNKVPVLLNRASITLPQLYQLLEVNWVTQGGVTLQLGTQTIGTAQLVDPDTDAMVFDGLTADVLDRANRYLRLLPHTGLQMWELDWALEQAAGGVLDDMFLAFLADTLTAQQTLNLPFQEVLTFWAGIETRDVTSHLGDADAVIPSTYSEIFATPTMLASWSDLFGDPTQLSGAPILPAAAAPVAADLRPLNGVAAALGLSAADISAILADSGAANALSLPTLTVLVRYARLASSMSLALQDLILWLAIAEATPFGTTPADTQEAIRRIGVLQGTGIALRDLDYLLRHQSASQSAAAFTSVQASAVLQSVRDAVVKAIAVSALTTTSISDAAPIVVTTASPNGLATGAEVLIVGVTGNTAANGAFTITVTDANTFSLNGSTGNGAWNGDGYVTGDLSGAIQTIVVAALASSVGVSADVITPVMNAIGILPLNAATIAALAAQAQIDASQFPVLNTAFTRVAKAATLFTALSPAVADFAFLVQNAATFRWLDPASLPTVPTALSNYKPFEMLLQALKLQGRQAARTPKLFDVFGAWLQPGGTPSDAGSAIDGPTLTVVGASAAAPIQITTTVAHGLASGAQVTVSGVEGDTGANGAFTITVTGATTFTLNGSAGNGAWSGGGTVAVVGAPSLAQALSASAADVTTLAAALTNLTVAAPVLNPVQQPGTLADIAALTFIAKALDVAVRYGVSGSTLLLLASPTPDANSAAAATGALQGLHPQSAWLAAVRPVEDTLREMRRDALVACLIKTGEYGIPEAQFLDADDIYNFYLIDPEMGVTATTTRLLQASLAIQQLVNQAFLSLSIGPTIDTADARWSEWSWRQQYRLWQANRQVFLYPENYVLPETRNDASPFFATLESDLRQGNADAESAETAFENYLLSLVSVANLKIAAVYNEVRAAGPHVLHVFGCTNGTPAQWFYRTQTRTTPYNGVWTAWTPLNLNIPSDQVIPMVWDQRLFLFWPIFTQVAEKQTAQQIPPAGGGGTTASPQPFFAVQLAMSEFSAGQWQTARVFDQKVYFIIQLQGWDGSALTSPQDFYFTASQNSSFGLSITVYANWWGAAQYQAATLTITTPDSPLVAEQYNYVMPGGLSFAPSPNVVDRTQEPSFFTVTITNLNNYVELGNNTPYFPYQGQNIAWGLTGGAYAQQVTAVSGAPATIMLAEWSPFTYVTVPQQEGIWDSLDPFFMAEPNRTFMVQPHLYGVNGASQPPELENLGRYPSWTITYEFHSFYHPYARTFLRELEIGGIPQLMSRTLQTSPQSVRGWPAFDFTSYVPVSPPVVAPYPGKAGATDLGEAALDFRAGSSGAYSLYNWELFYHAPMFVASLLMQNQQFQPAMQWLEYIFNPTDSSTQAFPNKFWQTAPFNAMSDWADQQINILLEGLDTGDLAGVIGQIDAWMADPYDPHMIASLRIAAYAKATVMSFLNNLIAWGDSLYTQYTAETVSQAEQLYIFADLLLGPAPDQIRIPLTAQNPPLTYATLQNVDAFSNTLAPIENIIIAPDPPQSLIDGTSTPPTLPHVPVAGTGLLFCIPPNTQMLAYWDTVADRLSNIRSGLNLQGMAVPLPLYAPPLNPLLLIAAQASGAGASGALAAAPLYRFNVYLRKAADLTNELRSFAGLILSALEKQDEENLAVLRATQELQIQTLMLDVKAKAVTEAQDQVAALVNQQAVTQIRYDYYSTIEFLNAWETQALAQQQETIDYYRKTIGFHTAAAVAQLVPEGSFGVAGFGGTPTVSLSYGGSNIAGSASAWASLAGAHAGISGAQAGISATTGGYHRRQDDWTLQADLAKAELTQMASQIQAANDHVATAQSEVAQQQQAIANAQAQSAFLTSKYTNAQLYNWMVTQLTTVYAQAYQLAFGLALQAQAAYQYELGRPTDQFIQFAYWDSQHKGLTAGESLLFDLRRMEAQYLVNNLREQEVTRHVSLAQVQPQALIQLLQTGTCLIMLDESLFDRDHPGQYFRRLRQVAVTIPCVTGPYTGVNASLILGQSVIRTAPPGGNYTPYSWSSGPTTDPNIGQAPPSSAPSTITISTGRNDSGLFDPNLQDERWLPFEGQGAVSSWALSLDPRDNNFDLSSVTDVVLHIRYTARIGGDVVAVRKAVAPVAQRGKVLVSARDTFGDAYYAFFNPADAAATGLTLALPFSNALFPYSGQGTPQVTDATVIMAFVEPLSKDLASAITSNVSIGATFGPASGTSTISLAPVSATGAADGGPVAALSSGDLAVAPAPPGPLTLTVPLASIPTSLQVPNSNPVRLDPTQVSDIVLVVGYTVS
jgi:Tc toxin complex TcA C-terminal TcB-binding domain/Neuraminidase-like domain/Putative peptidoglycan binding domain/Salmonella virulence plasmid 28.1kDa A protein